MENFDKITKKTEEIPLIYFCREAERAIGIEDYLKNYHIACVESHHIVDSLKKKGINIYCAQDEGEDISNASTGILFDMKTFQNWLADVTKESNGKFYGLLFQNSGPLEYTINKLGGILLNNSYEITKPIEDKIFQYKILQDHDISVPDGEIVELKDQSYTDFLEKYKNEESKFVIQTRKSHTGKGTFIISSANDFENVKAQYLGSLVKVTKFVSGEVITVNGCVVNKDVVVSPIQYQITGIPELADGSGTTVGNDWSYSHFLTNNIKNTVKKMVLEVGNILKSKGYLGIFGLDIIADIQNSMAYLIEINSRQTANIPMQTHLELLNNRTTMLELHIGSLMQLDLDISKYTSADMEGSQIFLRSKVDGLVVANHKIKNGNYRLQSDNSATDWKSGKYNKNLENVIFIDEEKDMPLIFQSEAYKPETNSGFLILTQKKEVKKFLAEELARMQFTKGIVDSKGNVAPWIVQALEEIHRLMR